MNKLLGTIIVCEAIVVTGLLEVVILKGTKEIFKSSRKSKTEEEKHLATKEELEALRKEFLEYKNSKKEEDLADYAFGKSYQSICELVRNLEKDFGDRSIDEMRKELHELLDKTKERLDDHSYDELHEEINKQLDETEAALNDLMKDENKNNKEA